MASSDPSASVAWRDDTPLVGRDAETAVLATALADAGREGVTLRLAGEAGIGKSRLARWLAASSHAARRVVVWGNAAPHDVGLPLGVVQDALRADREARPGAAPREPLAATFPARVLPELGGVPPDEATGRAVLFEAAARWARETARAGGLILVLEDLHWADATSLDLVAHLARVCRRDPVALLLTYRVDEPGAEGLDEMRRALARLPGREVELGPLADDEAVEVAAAAVGHDLAAPVARRVARLSGGNPFAAQELARAGGEAEDGDVPWTLRDMIGARLERLDPGDLDLVRWAAVMGPRFDVDVLAAVCGRDGAALLAGLARLTTAGLVTDDGAATPGRRMAFRHVLLQVAVRDGLLGLDRRARHAALLAAGAEDGPSPLPLQELLDHAAGAGDRERALALALRAAREAQAMEAPAEALALLERARDLWQDGDGEALLGEILLDLGTAVAEVRGTGAARDALTRAIGILERSGRTEDATEARFRDHLTRFREGDASAIDDQRRLLAALPEGTGPAVRAHGVQGLAALLMMSGGDPAEITALVDQGLALADPLEDRERDIVRLRLLNVRGIMALQDGDLPGGRDAMLEAGRLARATGSPAGDVIAHSNLALLSVWDAGPPLAEAAAFAEQTLATAARRGTRALEAGIAAACAWTRLRMGDLAAADAHIARAADALDAWPDGLQTRFLDVVRAERMLVAGDLTRALGAFSESVRSMESAHDESLRDARIGLAMVLLAAGSPGDALAAVAPWAEEITERPSQLRLYGSGLVVAVEAALAAGDDRAPVWAGLLAEHAPGPRARVAAGLTAAAAGDASGLDEAEAGLGEIAATGRVWEAARGRLVAAEALGGVYRDTASRLAAAARSAWVEIAADPWARRTERLLRELGQAVGSRRSRGGAGGLTRRELDVLRLLAEGLTNEAIAARLYVSRHTVNTHVVNILRKLGVERRAGAVGAARERGLLD